MKITSSFVIQVLLICTLFGLFVAYLCDYVLTAYTLRSLQDNMPMPNLPIESAQQSKKELILVTPKKKDLHSRIDWHDYALIEYEKNRHGRGENGAATKLYDNETFNYYELYDANGFNAALSDYISVNRSIPDIRHPECRKNKYLKKLPTTSVVIPFHNEHWTTLLRNVHSLINRSPPKLLKEIILVNDCSTKSFSKGPLDDYMKANVPKVKIVHLPERGGLIVARLEGIKVATGDVIIVLDSHCEVNVNWLPPLLEPIAMDYKTCVCPFVDVIDYATFEYRAQDEGARGAFDWNLLYKRLPIYPEDRLHPAQPFKSPVMAGGLFAMSRKFFWELGGYDEGLEIWGGEQYELSFKIWMCGGQMLDHPCSRVGHIYRHGGKGFPNKAKPNFLGINFRRVMDVWMDEYAEYVYLRKPELRNLDPGDISKYKQLRKNLHCKPFKWFMNDIAPDLIKKYPLIPPENFAEGQIRSVKYNKYCLYIDGAAEDNPIRAGSCIEHHSYKSFTFTYRTEIRVSSISKCFDCANIEKGLVTLFTCHESQGNQLFNYTMDTKQIIFGSSDHCLTFVAVDEPVKLKRCEPGSDKQQWLFAQEYPDAIKKFRLHNP